jgi:membrane fusion protein (multidrug efflux system)
MIRMKKQHFAQNLLLVISLSLGIVSCKEEKHKEEARTFNVTKPWRENVEITRQYVAQIRAIQHIEVRAFEKGYLQQVFVDEGQLAKKDDKMFQIMPYLVNAEFNRAKAEYEISRIEYENTKMLAKKKVVSVNELALTKAKFDKFAAELNLAQTHLDLTTIKAPFDGVIDRFRVRLGSLVEEGEILTTLSDISKLWVYFNLSESDYLSYMGSKKEQAANTKVKLLLANGAPYVHEGLIDAIEADFDNVTGNIPFRATFPNPDRLLRHGETGNIVLSKMIDNALVIPQKATFEIVDKRFVYVVNEKGVLDVREIVVEKEVAHFFVIKSGLSEKDTVLLEGIGKLSKGEMIRTKVLAKSDVIKGLELKAQ